MASFLKIDIWPGFPTQVASLQRHDRLRFALQQVKYCSPHPRLFLKKAIINHYYGYTLTPFAMTAELCASGRYRGRLTHGCDMTGEY